MHYLFKKKKKLSSFYTHFLKHQLSMQKKNYIIIAIEKSFDALNIIPMKVFHILSKNFGWKFEKKRISFESMNFTIWKREEINEINECIKKEKKRHLKKIFNINFL